MSVLVFGDTHFKYQNKKAIKWAIDILYKLKPKYVVQIGDLYDFYHFSKYTKSMISFTPEEEVLESRKEAEKFWKDVVKASPKSIRYQLLGNHCERPYKRLLEKAPELEPFYDHKALFRFKGVETIFNPKKELLLKINGQEVMFLHGHRAKLGDHLVYNQVSTVCGHSHIGGVIYKKYADETRFELNAGYLADSSKGPLQYGAQLKRYWTLGVGVIDQYGPRFIPFKG